MTGVPNRAAAHPTLAEASTVWARIGLLSFGGPAAQISLMHRELVEKRKWLNEEGYLNALSFCMLLPGPEAMQLATYAGWRLHGTLGGLLAGLLFVLPGAGVILLLAGLYAWFGDVPLVEALFLGIKAAVLVIVLEALVKVARRALTAPVYGVIALLAFVALFLFDAPFPFVILVAGLTGAFLTAPSVASQPAASPTPSALGTLQTAALWLAIWWLPLFALDLLLPGHVLGEIGRFFSVLATVTFGGAYAVLAYMAQEAVAGFGWLTAEEMADALGLAETTPGPLILVTEFVGFLAAARAGGGLSPWMGVAGAAVTLWVTFAPCFLWIFVGAPYIERLRAMPRLHGALKAITATVVGVILNLALWFALQVAFEDLSRPEIGPMRPWVPALDTLNWRVPILAGISAILLVHWRRSVLETLVVCAAAGLALSALS
ncbi:MAG: chromate efflux transporter [Pseudomonadota bacterium]